jgi:hypothetical protein
MKSVIRSRYCVVHRSGLVGTALALWIGRRSGEFNIRHSSRRILLLVTDVRRKLQSLAVTQPSNVTFPRIGANTGE